MSRRFYCQVQQSTLNNECKRRTIGNIFIAHTHTHYIAPTNTHTDTKKRLMNNEQWNESCKMILITFVKCV